MRLMGGFKTDDDTRATIDTYGVVETAHADGLSSKGEHSTRSLQAASSLPTQVETSQFFNDLFASVAVTIGSLVRRGCRRFGRSRPRRSFIRFVVRQLFPAGARTSLPRREARLRPVSAIKL